MRLSDRIVEIFHYGRIIARAKLFDGPRFVRIENIERVCVCQV